ncbi:NACHT domain-containing protein [Paenibacillus tritici]|uniref:NACHT domain-containing protein n=1 Tax=Paenibacillus tritici TaxID=1873425 RepID=UPI001BA5F125|nr:NACHT domain-containing protein [Paenibacillus tritici]QUL53407.1 NACHT domain-containing protein [Paenibacillus tritici]
MKYIDENQIKEELVEVEMKKPIKFANKEYPLNQLTDKEFELLLFESFRKNGTTLLKFDGCHLIAGTGDQGRDIIMVQKGKTVGVIQCKKYEALITKPQAVKEIIKFVLLALQQPRIYDFNNLSYYFAVSKGFNQTTSALLDHFSTEIEHESKLNDWILDVQNEFKKTSLDPSIDFNRILAALKSMNVQKLLPHDIAELMDEEIINSFFVVDKIIDVKTFQNMLQRPQMELNVFMKQYRESQKNNFSRINFFGLSLTTKPREIPFEKLFVKPTLQRHGQKNSNYFFFDIDHVDKTKKTALSINAGSGKSTFMLEGLSEKIYQELLVKNHIHFFEDLNMNQENLELFTKHTNHLFEGSQMQQDKLHLEAIFKSKKNVVILGKPGAGKSSLVKHLMIHLLSKQNQDIPIRVELHKYNHEKKRDSIGFIDYIFNQLRSEHQIHKLMKEDIVNFLTQYKVIIFFDGMDEVLDVQDRISIRNDIENIAAQYKDLKCVVTSRFESYDEVYFDPQQFELFEVNDFDDEQVKEFVHKWYGIEETNTDIRRREVDSCIKELQHIEDELKRNPLLLTLIVILYRNELELPTSKLDVYENCTLTLVDTRDNKEKKLALELPISNKIATFSSLAYWQFEKLLDKNQAPFTYAAVQMQVRNYLLEKGEFEYEHDADKVAQSFLEFAYIRSIYVENNFTHKTFLEYFTAYYVYSNLFSKGKMKELHQFIGKNLASSSWHVVIELLICKIDKAQGDFSVIDDIVEEQLLANGEEAILFFLPILKHLQNISPRMITRLFEESIAITIQNEISTKSGIIRSMNSHLMELTKNERFAAKLTKKFDEYESNILSTRHNNSYNIFLLENGIITSSRYIQIVTDEEMRESTMKNNPYIFTLIAVPQMTNANAYFSLFKEYVVAYNNKALTMTHRTKYGNNMFFGSNSFHWIATYLFSKDYERFIDTVQLLMNYGINRREIIEGIKQDDGSIQMSNDVLLSLLDTETNGARKEIILAALKKYYGYDLGNKKSNGPFYKNLGKQNRKFPIPR